MTAQNEPIIGYSGFDVFEECYGYNEDACYVADTEASANRFMRAATLGTEYRIEPVTLSQMMDDYGSSFGEFAMEKEAFLGFALLRVTPVSGSTQTLSISAPI